MRPWVSMRRGWDATGLLRPLWVDYPGGRDGLAEAIGTSPSVLSTINTGKRPLGWSLAERLADELGVSVEELGAPGPPDPKPESVPARLRSLEAALAEVLDHLATVTDDLADARTRLVTLETARGTQARTPTR